MILPLNTLCVSFQATASISSARGDPATPPATPRAGQEPWRGRCSTQTAKPPSRCPNPVPPKSRKPKVRPDWYRYQHHSTTAPQHRNTQVKHSIKTQIHYLMNLHISLSFSRGQEVKLTDEKRRRRWKDSFLFLQLNNRLPPSSNSNNRETPPEHTNTFHCRPPLTFILVLLILIWSSCVYLD